MNYIYIDRKAYYGCKMSLCIHRPMHTQGRATLQLPQEHTHLIYKHQSTNYQWPTCAIQGSHSSAVENSGLVGCDTVSLGELSPMLHTTVFITLRTILILKANKMHYFSTLFGKELCMFQTDLLSIIRSLNTVFIAIGVRHTSYVACPLAGSWPR